MMDRTRRMVVAALAFAFGLGTAVASASSLPFADLDNDGELGPGDVPIGELIMNDGRFSTNEAEGDYQPPAGPVSIVIPAGAAPLKLRRDDLVLVATGDITVGANLLAAGPDGMVLLASAGSIQLAPGTRVVADGYVQLAATGDVTVGAGSKLHTRGRDFGDVVSLSSETGSVTIGERTVLAAAGLCHVATADERGGQIVIGPRSRLTSGKFGMVAVTAGLDLDLQAVKLSAPNLLLGSRASVHSPGHASIRNSAVKARGRHGLIHIYANGEGSVIDLTGTRIKVPRQATLSLDADQVIR